MKRSKVFLGILALIVPLLFLGCEGDDGASAPTTGTIAGTVTDNTTGGPIAGVTVTAKDSGGTTLATTTTNASGEYSLTAPIGTVTVNFSQTYYTSPGGMMVGVLGGQKVTVNAAMNESATGKPSVSFASVAGDDFGYGATVALAASGNDPNGDTLTYKWENATGGVPLIGTVTGTGTTGSLTFPTMAEAMAPRADPTAFNDISGTKLEDRFSIVPVIPDTRGAITARVTVSDGRGQSVTASLTLNAASIVAGVQNVARNTRVYLNRGDDNNAQTWSITAKPAGSTAALDNDTIRTPSFVPDVAGKYTVAAGSNAMDIYAGDWVGVIGGGTGNNITPDTSCTVCHNGGIAVDAITPWMGTGHARIFTLGINAPNAGSSGEGCLVCHTVGYDKGTDNGGYDDVAAAAGFVFPSVLQAGNWDNVPLAVKKLANIQCENCHGPNSGGAHMLTGSAAPGVPNDPFASPRIEYSAEVCGTCHGRTSHNIYSQWATLGASGKGHSNRFFDRQENSHCGRCHSAQGFTVYVERLGLGKTGSIDNTTALGAKFLSSVKASNVHAITCTACHDPHSDANPNQLRVYGDTAMLPSGFKVVGVGKGALCITCHNTRNSAHNDATPPTSYSAPHTAAQGDVLAGQNAFFMGSSLPMVSKHAAVEDTCVGCHMKLQTPSRIAHGEDVAKTHLFRIEGADIPAVCANCHSTNVNGEGTIAAIEAGLHALEAKMAEAALLKINDATINSGVRWVRAYDEHTDLYSSSDPDGSSGPLVAPANVSFDVNTNPVIHVEVIEGHGQIEFHLTLTDNVTILWTDGSQTTTKEFGVQLGSLQLNNTTDKTLQVPLYGVQSANGPNPGNSRMVRAAWNYFLIEADDSEGIHNPGFAQAVLNATLAEDLSE